MQLKFKTLSPIHIGSGETLAPLDYVVHKYIFYKIEQNRFYQFIEEKIPDGRRAFAGWISERFKEMKGVNDNKELSRMQKSINPFEFCKEYGKEYDLIGFLRNSNTGVAQMPVILDEKLSRVANKGHAISLNQVREIVKTGRNVPYIPGTSIKGVLRTALFYHYLTHFADWKEVSKMIKKLLSEKLKKERFSQELMQSVFFCLMQNEKGKEKNNDEQMDLLKVIRISDGKVKDAKAQLEMAKVNIYLVKKEKNGQYTNLRAQVQGQTSYSEIIKAGAEITCDLDVDMYFLLRLKNLLKADKLQKGRAYYWIGVEKKVKQLLGIDLNTLAEENLETKRQEIFRYLFAAVRTFSNLQLQSDQDWRVHFKEHDSSNLTDKLEKGYQQVDGKAGTTLWHIGYGTSFEGTTALFYFLENQQRKDLLAEIMEAYELGNAPGKKGEKKAPYTVDPKNIRFPKSKRLVEKKDFVTPLGWMQLLLEGEENIAKNVEEGEKEESREIKPEFVKGEINYKKPPLLEGVIVKAGRPNQVQVYIDPGNMPTLRMDRYRNPLEVGTVVVLEPQFAIKKKKLTQVSFKSIKK